MDFLSSLGVLSSLTKKWSYYLIQTHTELEMYELLADLSLKEFSHALQVIMNANIWDECANIPSSHSHFFTIGFLTVYWIIVLNEHTKPRLETTCTQPHL